MIERDTRVNAIHTQTCALTQTTTWKDNDYLGDSRVNMWATLTHKNSNNIIFNLLLVPTTHPPFLHFSLTFSLLSLRLCLFIFLISSSYFHCFRYRTQLHWLTGGCWHSIPSKVTLPFCGSISPFLLSMFFALSSSDFPLFVTVCRFLDPDQSFG